MQINIKSKAQNLKPNSGFTLIEILAAIFLFSLLVLVASSAFISFLNLQRRAFNIQQAEENANFVMESMAKEIRVSQIIGPDACAANTLNIIHPVNGNITYSLSGNAIHRNVSGTDSVISSNAVQFTNLAFCISGTATGDSIQPRVTIIASLKSTKTSQQAAINFQTTVSQRLLSN